MIVVITGFIDYILADMVVPGLAALRLFKVLRPLRALQRVRGMRVLVQTIMGALPQMCRVFAVLMFVLLVWGIIGQQLFNGRTRHQCHYKEMESNPGCPVDRWGLVLPGCDLDDVWTGNWASTGSICNPYCTFDIKTQTLDGDSTSREKLLEWQERTPPGETNWTCGSLGNSTRQIGPDTPGAWLWTCEPDQQCRCGRSGKNDASCEWNDNPNFGLNSFDNIISACITIFQSITLEGWVDVMYMLMDGAGASTPDPDHLARLRTRIIKTSEAVEPIASAHEGKNKVAVACLGQSYISLPQWHCCHITSLVKLPPPPCRCGRHSLLPFGGHCGRFHCDELVPRCDCGQLRWCRQVRGRW